MEKNWEHLLVEIPLTAIAAVLSGAESRNDRKEYGEACFPVGYRRDEDGGDVCTGLRRHLMETLPRRWLSMAAETWEPDFFALGAIRFEGDEHAQQWCHSRDY